MEKNKATMTHQEFINSDEYATAPESARIEYQTRLGILCGNAKPDYFQHLIAMEDFNYWKGKISG